MKRVVSLLVVAVVFGFAALQVNAQEQPVRKSPKLTMDNFEGGRMILPSVKKPRETETPSADAASGGITSVNARAVLSNAFTQLGKVKSLRIRMVMVNLQGEEREAAIEVVYPNRIHVSSSGYEIIGIGQTLYTRLNGDAWKKTTDLPTGAADSFNPKNVMESALSAPGIAMSAWAIGEEMIGGAQTTVYEIIVEEQMKNNQSISSLRLWVGKTDALPHKMEFSSLNSALRMSLYYKDFNTNIAINAPRM